MKFIKDAGNTFIPIEHHTTMPRQLSDCVGDWFEEILRKQLPELKKVRDRNEILPDFSCPIFDAEAKAGYWEYGAQLKEFQVEGFNPNGKPIIYLIGYHSISGLRALTQNMDEEEMDALLENKGEMHSAYAVSNDIIKRIWGKEHKISKRDKQRIYFSVRPRHLDAIIYNKSFERVGVRHMPSRWYGISRQNLLLHSAPSLRGAKNLKFGAILDKETDRGVIEYLEEQDLL